MSSILSRLDNSEIADTITDEELEEIGAAYGSKRQYEETLRELAERLSGPNELSRILSTPGRTGKSGARIKAGTSTVPVGNLPKVKRINIVGKVLRTAEEAVQLFSAFRDPRIEIFNIAYTSDDGKVLAHTAWTVGLPGMAPAFDDAPSNTGERIIDLKERLDAKNIWIAHNHPSGNPSPSDYDIRLTKLYGSILNDSLRGHLILNHDKYGFISPDGNSVIMDLFNPLEKVISNRQENSLTVRSANDIACMFKKVMANNENTTAFAVLDNAHRVVSWLYSDSDNVQEIKNYTRVCGGSKAVVMTNSRMSFEKYETLFEKSVYSDKDIFLDIIKVDRKGQFEHSARGLPASLRGDWQTHEQKKIRYVVNNQGLKPPLLGREKNIKENIMSDATENTEDDKRLSPKELAYRDAVWQRTAIVAAMKNGTLACLPGPDGYADTQPAVNLANDSYYHGDTLLYLKDHTKRNGFPTAEYATSKQIDRAKEDTPGLYIIKGQKGVNIHFSEKDNETGEYINKHARLFNVAQLSDPAAYKKWAANEALQDYNDYIQVKRTQHGNWWTPPEKAEKTAVPEITCSSSEPEKYIGQYLAAVSMGGKFKATSEQAEEFKQKFGDSLYAKVGKVSEKTGEKVTDPFKLSKISREANKHCKDFISEFRKTNEQKIERKQEQTLGRSR